MNFTLKEIRPETAEASTFIFTSDTPVVYKPGQHIVLRLPHENPDNRGITRPFTLSSSPTQEGIVTMTTKKGPSRPKQALFALPIGSTIEVKGPVGNLYLLEDQPGPHIMLAGGIGITPFRSMIKCAFDKRLTIPIILLYSNKTDEVIFKKELGEIAKQVQNIHVVYKITSREGRIDEAMIKEYCPDIPHAIFYTAGPTGLVEAMIALLTSMGVPPEHVRFEKFSGY